MNEKNKNDGSAGTIANGSGPRLCVLLDTAGYFAGVVSDVPIRVFIIDEGAPTDRVYQLTEGIGVQTGVQYVTGALGNDPVGHMNDNTLLGSGLGERRGPATPDILPVDVDLPQDQ